MGNKIKTVIASVLKPVDDTRMYEKFGHSLQQTNRYEVNIIGFISKNPPEDRDIKFYPIFNFKNNSWKRLFASLKFGKILFKIAPKLTIVTTYELLPIAILYKFISPHVKVVYDIQENYALNVQTNKGKSIISKIFARVIRFIETSCQKFISLNFLAEENYAKEISFIRNNSLLILNKYVNRLAQDTSNANDFGTNEPQEYQPVLLYNGTISENYGILEAINLAKALANVYPGLLLIIMGHVTSHKLLNYLECLDKKLPFIQTIIDTNPIPHAEIVRLISYADFGIVAHHPVESIKYCFPTRIYEYMAHQKPFILQDHSYWTDYCNPWKCAINIDFKNFDTHFVAQQMKTRQFYTKGIPDDIFWTTEASKLLKAIDNLFCISH